MICVFGWGQGLQGLEVSGRGRRRCSRSVRHWVILSTNSIVVIWGCCIGMWCRESVRKALWRGDVSSSWGVCNKMRSVKRAAPPIGLACFVCKCVFRPLVIHDWGVIHGNWGNKVFALVCFGSGHQRKELRLQVDLRVVSASVLFWHVVSHGGWRKTVFDVFCCGSGHLFFQRTLPYRLDWRAVAARGRAPYLTMFWLRRKLGRFRAVSASKVVSRCCR